MFDVVNVVVWIFAYFYLFTEDWKLAVAIFLIIGSNNYWMRYRNE